MTPYTSEAIDRIRSWARQGYPHGYVAAMLGWDIGRLLRAAEKHRIDFVRITAVSRTPDPKVAKIHWDGRCAWHGSKHVYLPPTEGRIFEVILKHPDYDWNTEKMAACAELPKKCVSAHMSQLRANLESIGLTVTRRTYELERL